jgi:hypothetical protein
MSNLCFFLFGFVYDADVHHKCETLTWLVDTLGGGSISETIEVITLSLDLRALWHNRTVEIICMDGLWGDLDAALADATYSKLRNVYIFVHSPHPQDIHRTLDGSRIGDIQYIVRTRLPLLNAKGVLSVQPMLTTNEDLHRHISTMRKTGDPLHFIRNKNASKSFL